MEKLIITDTKEITDFLTYRLFDNNGVAIDAKYPKTNSYFSIKDNVLLQHVIFKRDYTNCSEHDGYVSIISLEDLPCDNKTLISRGFTNESPRCGYYEIKISAIEKIEFEK